MPTYQYACTDCGDRSEVVQRFTDEPLTVCSVCGGKLRKVFSPVGIVFKGSGFYRNDSRESAGSKSLVGANGNSSNGDSGSKDSGSKDSGSKDSGSKDSGSKESGSSSSSEKKDSGSSSSSSTGSNGSSSSTSTAGSKVA